jgi:hypothetical protein
VLVSVLVALVARLVDEFVSLWFVNGVVSFVD